MNVSNKILIFKQFLQICGLYMSFLYIFLEKILLSDIFLQYSTKNVSKFVFILIVFRIFAKKVNTVFFYTLGTLLHFEIYSR
jgi:hypothetical protein